MSTLRIRFYTSLSLSLMQRWFFFAIQSFSGVISFIDLAWCQTTFQRLSVIVHNAVKKNTIQFSLVSQLFRSPNIVVDKLARAVPKQIVDVETNLDVKTYFDVKQLFDVEQVYDVDNFFDVENVFDVKNKIRRRNIFRRQQIYRRRTFFDVETFLSWQTIVTQFCLKTFLSWQKTFLSWQNFFVVTKELLHSFASKHFCHDKKIVTQFCLKTFLSWQFCLKTFLSWQKNVTQFCLKTFLSWQKIVTQFCLQQQKRHNEKTKTSTTRQCAGACPGGSVWRLDNKVLVGRTPHVIELPLTAVRLGSDRLGSARLGSSSSSWWHHHHHIHFGSSPRKVRIWLLLNASAYLISSYVISWNPFPSLLLSPHGQWGPWGGTSGEVPRVAWLPRVAWVAMMSGTGGMGGPWALWKWCVGNQWCALLLALVLRRRQVLCVVLSQACLFLLRRLLPGASGMGAMRGMGGDSLHKRNKKTGNQPWLGRKRCAGLVVTRDLAIIVLPRLASWKGIPTPGTTRSGMGGASGMGGVGGKRRCRRRRRRRRSGTGWTVPHSKS